MVKIRGGQAAFAGLVLVLAFRGGVFHHWWEWVALLVLSVLTVTFPGKPPRREW